MRGREDMQNPDIVLAIFEAAFETKEEVHDYIAKGLDFPDYYGKNLDALHDCLTDISQPVLISLVRMRDECDLASWFDKLAVALMASGRENPQLDVEIVFEDALD